MPTRFRRLAEVAVLTFQATLPAAASDRIPPCQPPQGAQHSTQLGSIPSALAATLKQRIGELAPPNARFDSTDMAKTGHNRRLIFIWAIGNQWVVATEHGGIAYNDPIFAYVISADGHNAYLVEERIAFPRTVCPTARERMNPKPKTSPSAEVK